MADRNAQLLVDRIVTARGGAGAIGVAARLKNARVRIARRHDDGAPVHERGVHAQQRCFLAAVHVQRAAHGRHRLVIELTLLPQRAQGIDERTHLACHRAKARGRAEEISIRPGHVVVADHGNISRRLGVRGPFFCRLHHLLRGGLAHLAQAHLRTGFLGRLGRDLRHGMVGAVGAVINNGQFDLGHDSPLLSKHCVKPQFTHKYPINLSKISRRHIGFIDVALRSMTPLCRRLHEFADQHAAVHAGKTSENEPMKLYSYFRSGTSYRVRIALHLKGLDYEYIPVNLLADEQDGTAFRAINPQGLVPALTTDDGVLIQSPAIMEWLEERYPNPPLLPADATGRARVRALAALIGCDIHPINNRRILQALRHDFGAGKAAVLHWCAHWISEGFDALDALLATDTQRDPGFCYGDGPTLADAYLIPQIASARRFEVDMQRWPRLLAIDTACNALDAFQRAAPQRQPDATGASK